MKRTLTKLVSMFLVLPLLCVTAFAEGETGEIFMESDSGEVDEVIFAEDGTDYTANIEIPAPSAILIEKETGSIIFEKNPDEKLAPASVTKVMTILLIVEAVNSGKITLDDMVTTSSHAASMGGSQVYLEEGEQMKADEMLKCIVVSSANDAAVAMAELIAGSEEAFADMMNRRAAELNMTNTHFTNCTGLIDDDDHYSTARDISLMSRELIKHDWIKKYTTIWMDTARGGKFGLSNTNKLIYYYKGSTGLKTGFTQKAGHCLSATAEKDGMELIAVTMHCESSNDRFESAKKLLNYGFANYALADTKPDEGELFVKVKLGREKTVVAVPESAGKILIAKTSAGNIKKTVTLEETANAPVLQGQKLGTLIVAEGDNIVAEIPLIAEKSVEKLTYWDIFIKIVKIAFTGTE